MFSAKDVDIDSLPSVPLREARSLPSVSAVYMAVIKRVHVAYVGRALNLKRRWASSHHRFKQLIVMGDCRLHWIELPAYELIQAERGLISLYRPPLNGASMPASSPKSFRLSESALCALSEIRAYQLVDETGAVEFALLATAARIHSLQKLIPGNCLNLFWDVDITGVR